MNRQQIFDKVATHLIKQGKKANNPLGCAYLAPDGSKCAIGCLTPRDKYLAEFEGKLLGSAAVVTPILRAAGLAKNQRWFASELQIIHDHNCELNPVPDWVEKLTEFAKKHNLSTAALARAVKRREKANA